MSKKVQISGERELEKMCDEVKKTRMTIRNIY